METVAVKVLKAQVRQDQDQEHDREQDQGLSPPRLPTPHRRRCSLAAPREAQDTNIFPQYFLILPTFLTVALLPSHPRHDDT